MMTTEKLHEKVEDIQTLLHVTGVFQNVALNILLYAHFQLYSFLFLPSKKPRRGDMFIESALCLAE
jgi:hypothetical protein